MEIGLGILSSLCNGKTHKVYFKAYKHPQIKVKGSLNIEMVTFTVIYSNVNKQS